MASTEVDQVESTTSERHIVPVFVVDFDDERARSRLREAAFVSVIFHLVLFILLLLSPKWMARLMPVNVATAADLMHDRELTYLDLPHDRQQVSKPPTNAKAISDKDRIAMSRRPTIDRKTLDELQDPRRAGRPEAPGPQTPPQMAQGPPVPQAPT